MTKVALITGASSGFGILSAIELAKAGFLVLATMRDPSRGGSLIQLAEANQVDSLIKVHQLDVTEEKSIQTLEGLLKEAGRVDVLVNNAGYAAGGFVEETNIETYRAQFETNFFGAIAVTQQVLPYMRRQKSGKIINISSISGQVGFPGLSPYVSSKFALEGFSESLRLEMKPFGVDVLLIEPGSYKTNIWSVGKELIDLSGSEHSPYQITLQKIRNRIESKEDKYGDPNEVACLIAKLASQEKDDQFRYPIGKGVRLGIWFKKRTPWKVWEKLILRNVE